MAILGIDIGGTSIKGGLVDNSGKITRIFSCPIDKKLSQEEQILVLIKVIKQTYKENDFEGIGLGIPGAIDSKRGFVEFSNNLNWHNFDIKALFEKEFPNKRIATNNDANVAALGESRFGSAKNEKNVVLITLGTGVGSGIIIDGKIYEGEHGRGAEIGHSLLVLNGKKCTCGRKGCLEMYASATALVNQAKEMIDLNPKSKLALNAKSADILDGRVIFETAKSGCEVAEEVVNNYVMYLSEGLINICNIFRPSSIILSGGLANQGDFLVNKIISYLEEHTYGFPPTAKVAVKCAALGYNSGMIGSASLLMD